MIIPSPIERKIYKKSSYFKKFDVKYRVGIIYDFRYKLYEKLLKNYENVKSYNLDNYMTKVLVVNSQIIILGFEYSIYYDKLESKWVVEGAANYYPENHPLYEVDVFDLDEYIYNYLNLLEIDFEDKNLIICLNKGEIEGSLKQAKEDERFLIYKNDKSLFKKLDSIFKEE